MYPSDYQEERNKQKINERRLKRLQKNRSMGADSRSELTTHVQAMDLPGDMNWEVCNGSTTSADRGLFC